MQLIGTPTHTHTPAVLPLLYRSPSLEPSLYVCVCVCVGVGSSAWTRKTLRQSGGQLGELSKIQCMTPYPTIPTYTFLTPGGCLFTLITENLCRLFYLFYLPV